MTAMAESPVALPFTTPCQNTGNFPDEYSAVLRWKCSRLEGHDGDCRPSDLDQRRYQRRLEIRDHCQIPEDVHLTGDMLRHVVIIAIRESDDIGVMWLLIRRYIAFTNFLRRVLHAT